MSTITDFTESTVPFPTEAKSEFPGIPLITDLVSRLAEIIDNQNGLAHGKSYRLIDNIYAFGLSDCTTVLKTETETGTLISRTVAFYRDGWTIDLRAITRFVMAMDTPMEPDIDTPFDHFP